MAYVIWLCALDIHISMIKKAPKDKAYTLAAFLDSEGAFNDVKMDAIDGVLESRNVVVFPLLWVLVLSKIRIKFGYRLDIAQRCSIRG